MKLEAYHWKQTQLLAEHYAHDFPRVADLFEDNPWDAAAWQRRVEWLDQPARPGADRKRLAEVLTKYNERIGNSSAASAAIEALASEDALVVVGGQQAGLFTGPLYVIHKAITVLQLARQAEETLRRRIVPVFWIAGEDHDFDEVNHTYVLSPQQEVRKLKIDHPTGSRSSVSQTAIPAALWEDALKQLDESLPATEFKPVLLADLQAMMNESATLSECFARIMARLFGDYGLVLVDSDDPLLRSLEGPMFEKLIRVHEELNDTFLEGSRRVEQLGYAPQAEVQAGSLNLFVYQQGERVLLHKADSGFADKKGEFAITESELIGFAETAPQRLSNNVMTRPIMQEYLFPVLCTVLGAGEIAYMGLTREAFRKVGMRMPLILPRLEFTLLEGTLQKHIQKFELTFADVVERFEDKKRDWLAAQDKLGLEERFAQVKEDFAVLYQPMLDTIKEINPGMKKLGDQNMQKIMEQIEFLQARSIEAGHAQFDAAIRQLDRIRASVVPLGKKQERVYNVYAYLNKYGDGWLRELVSMPLEVNGMHRIALF